MRHPFFALFVLLPSVVAAQQPETAARPVPQLSVSAVGSVMREPDQAVLNIAVESQAATARAAAESNAMKMAALISAVKAAGITSSNIRTISYQLNPQYSNPGPRTETAPRIVAYT